MTIVNKSTTIFVITVFSVISVLIGMTESTAMVIASVGAGIIFILGLGFSFLIALKEEEPKRSFVIRIKEEPKRSFVSRIEEEEEEED